MNRPVFLPIETLRFSTKKRRGVSPGRVEELRRKIEFGEDVLPIRVSALHDGTYVVHDGRHRIQAHIEAGIDCIYAFVDNLVTKLRRMFLFLFASISKANRLRLASFLIN